jgi:hypothetical protein
LQHTAFAAAHSVVDLASRPVVAPQVHELLVTEVGADDKPLDDGEKKQLKSRAEKQKLVSTSET